MIRFTRTLVACLLAGIPLFGAIQPARTAHTSRADVIRLNWDGFQQCRDFREEGTPFWAATAQGFLIDGGGATASSQVFHVNICFSSKSACHHWIDDIHFNISGIDELRYARCRQKG